MSMFYEGHSHEEGRVNFAKISWAPLHPLLKICQRITACSQIHFDGLSFFYNLISQVEEKKYPIDELDGGGSTQESDVL
jgi:hypothetical protein